MMYGIGQKEHFENSKKTSISTDGDTRSIMYKAMSLSSYVRCASKVIPKKTPKRDTIKGIKPILKIF